MISLRRRLGTGLAVSLLVVFGLQWLIVSISIRAVAESYVRSRLEHDADTLLAALSFDAAGAAHLDPSRIDTIYEQPFSGHYFHIQAGADTIRSRSLWDEDLKLPSLRPGQAVVNHAHGPQSQALLQVSRTFTKQGRALTLAVAEDLTPLEADLHRFNLRYALVSAIALIALLALQGTIVHLGLRPVDALRADLRRLGRGEISALREHIPDELLPLVREFNHLLALLSERLQRSRQSLGNLAHALKTPLTLLRDLAAQEEVRANPSLRTQLATQADTIHRLIERELKRARLAGGAQPGQRLDLGPEFARLTDTLKRLYRDKALTIEVELPATAAFTADREDMLELLGNLLDNACKWAVSRVRLTLSSDPGLHLVIEDDGPGVPAEALPQLSQRGLRLDERVAGHGLGLAIAEDIARSYGGSISFTHSTALGGLAVHVDLPPVANS